MESPRTSPDIDASPSPSVAVCAPFDDPVLNELSERMLSWSHAWFGASQDNGTPVEHRVRERLLYWVKRCIGGKATAVFTSHDEDVSMASSAPLLTALLGRKAMLELSRRVLNDS